MPFDYKKAYPALYRPKTTPSILRIPTMQFVAIEGAGDPNQENGAYQQALSLLYGISFTIRMWDKSTSQPPGYFPYVVPPLEGFWWMADGSVPMDYTNKADFCWLSVIRLPDFVTKEVFTRAQQEVSQKKKIPVSSAQRLTLAEGDCVQCLHVGPYDTEITTLTHMEAYAHSQGWQLDFSSNRRHHEIYLSDPRRTTPERCKTILRLPIRRQT